MKHLALLISAVALLWVSGCAGGAGSIGNSSASELVTAKTSPPQAGMDAGTTQRPGDNRNNIYYVVSPSRFVEIEVSLGRTNARILAADK
jgi:hypothetical protein